MSTLCHTRHSGTPMRSCSGDSTHRQAPPQDVIASPSYQDPQQAHLLACWAARCYLHTCCFESGTCQSFASAVMWPLLPTSLSAKAGSTDILFILHPEWPAEPQRPHAAAAGIHQSHPPSTCPPPPVLCISPPAAYPEGLCPSGCLLGAPAAAAAPAKH